MLGDLHSLPYSRRGEAQHRRESQVPVNRRSWADDMRRIVRHSAHQRPLESAIRFPTPPFFGCDILQRLGNRGCLRQSSNHNTPTVLRGRTATEYCISVVVGQVGKSRSRLWPAFRTSRPFRDMLKADQPRQAPEPVRCGCSFLSSCQTSAPLHHGIRNVTELTTAAVLVLRLPFVSFIIASGTHGCKCMYRIYRAQPWLACASSLTYYWL
jgi:hypothetical protein